VYFKIFLKFSKIQYHYNSSHSSEEHQAIFADMVTAAAKNARTRMVVNNQHLVEAFQSCRTLLI